MSGEFIQPGEAAEITGLSIASLAQLRYEGKGPRFYKPTPHRVLYKRAEVITWLEASARSTTAVRA